jgi:biopolymer transport protein TolR
MRIARYGEEAISDINVTPFVDVLLLLLVVFMITAPVITKDISINLPEESLKNIANANRDFIISYNAKGAIYLEKKKKNWDQLKKELQIYQKEGGKQVFIEADKLLKYGDIVRLMAFVQNLGFENIGLLVKEK